MASADGSGQQRLTRNPGVDGSPAWPPDGRKIAFETKRDASSEIDVVNADGRELRRVPGLAAYAVDTSLAA